MKVWSVPLQIAARLLAPVLLALSLVVLYRGHHLPGGGFIGGLLAASGIGLVLLGHGLEAARRMLRVEPRSLIAGGLGTAVVSGLFGPLLEGAAFMSGVWLPAFELPLLGSVHLGTPLLFDVGVYLTVVGFVLMCLFALVEADELAGEEHERRMQ